LLSAVRKGRELASPSRSAHILDFPGLKRNRPTWRGLDLRRFRGHPDTGGNSLGEEATMPRGERSWTRGFAATGL